MIKYAIVFASYLETEGLDASVAFYDKEEDAAKYLKQEYEYAMEDFKGGSVDWNEYEEGQKYSVGGSDRHGYNDRYEAYIMKVNFEEEK
jgi:hypothetical protein